MIRAKKIAYNVLCTVWAVLLLGIFSIMVARALPPEARLWELESVSQQGQLSVFNETSDAGWWGHPVELGDYDGDGLIDLVMGPMAADSGPAPIREKSGEVYVYPGTGEIAGIIDRSTATGAARGLTLRGARPGDFLGTELYSADVNGDGIKDLMLSAQNHDHHDSEPGGGDCCPGCRDNCGAVYVVFGRTGLFDQERTFDLARSTEALAADGILKIVGATPGERFGVWVEAGDLDGDGIDEILAGADQYPAEAGATARFGGKTYVIYGREEFPDFIDLATYDDGVSAILGADPNDHFGASLHSADLNADGYDELIVAAALNRLSAGFKGCSDYRAVGTGGGASGAGEVYVFHGLGDGARLPAQIDLWTDTADLLDDGKLTIIRGESPGDYAGEELTSGDFNGDGFTDLAVGALTADGLKGESNAGRAYIVYWKEGLEGMTIELGDFEPPPGAPQISTMVGGFSGDIFGDTMSSGDFNHDGIDDLAVGIPDADVDDEANAGIVAIVFGRPEPLPPLWIPQADEAPEGVQLAFVLGARNNDLMSYSMEAGDYDADGYADLYPNAMRGDGESDRFTNAGEAYVVSGFELTGTALGLERVQPSTGPLGVSIPVTVVGSGFTTPDDTQLALGGVPVESFEVLSATEIQATLAPANEAASSSLTITNRYGTATLENAFHHGSSPVFIRGDSNRDGNLDVSDPVHTLLALFAGGSFVCRDASDSNDDGKVDVSDPVYALNFLFSGGPEVPAPHPDAGEDPTADDLDCLE